MTQAEELVFEPIAHTYHHNGREVPSVTTILEPFSGMQFVDPEILRIAAEFGTHVHDACDLFNRGELDEALLMDESPLVWKHLDSWKQFLHDSGAVVIYSEQKVFHPTLRYAGTLDTICAISKTNRIYDIKTGSSVPKTVGPQVEAYNRAHRVATGDRLMKRYCVHLKENGYAVHPLTDSRDWDIFRAALTLHRWRN